MRCFHAASPDVLGLINRPMYSSMTLKLPTIVDVCRHWADAAPERVAYSCLRDGEEVKERLTFAQLDQRARAIAAVLQHQTTAGDRALLLYPTGVEYVAAFMGCLYAGVVAVPAYPIHGRDRRWQRRLEAMVEDAGPRLALTTSALCNVVDSLAKDDSVWRHVRGIATNEIDTPAAGQSRDPKVDGKTLAFLQYTSGTTAAPRGVMVSHANLAHQEALIQRTFRQHPGSVIVSWLPLYHDMGLIGSMLQTLYAGAHCILMSPASFLQKPVRWLRAISRFSATTSGGPNFAYDLCTRRVREEDKASLDLSSWEVAFNGAEPVRRETMEEFTLAFGRCGFRAEAFRPCYGLAESTLMVTASRTSWADQPVPVQTFNGPPASPSSDAAHQPTRRVVGCGPIDGQENVLIINPKTLARCAEGEMGEVWVTGPSVTAGYWQQEQETTHFFRARPAAASHGPDYLRTGDLGFQHQSQLFLVGRLKEMIIIRGLNHFPMELEATVERCDPSCRAESCVACQIELDGEGRLLVVHEIDRARLLKSPDEIISLIRQALVREHGINAYAVVLVEPHSIPITPSGKKQRRACGENFLHDRLQVVATSVLAADTREPSAESRDDGGQTPQDQQELEALLLNEAGRVLGLPAGLIKPHSPLTEFGLDSLTATELQACIETHLNVSLAPGAILEGCSVTELARVIRQVQATPVVPAPGKAGAPSSASLSEAEKSLWFLSKLAGDSGAHTVSRAARIRGPVDWSSMCSAIRIVVKRHEALRTTFPAIGGQPWAKVHDWLEPELEHKDTSAWDVRTLQRALDEVAARPFSLENGPLLRFALFSRSDTDHVLAFVLHHIVADLWSVCVLLDEVGQIYAAQLSGTPKMLPNIGISYREYLAKQERRLTGSEGQRMREYWRSALAGPLAPTNLPTDRPRSASVHFSAHTERIPIDASLAKALRQLGKQRDATLYMVLLAGFQVFLHKCTRQEDIIVGSPFHGRSGKRACDLVGCLTNLVVLRADMSRDLRFTDHLAKTRASVLGALDNQEYPFRRLVGMLQPRRDASRMPLCNLVFVFQSVPRQGQWPLFAIGDPDARLSIGPLHLQCLAAPEEATAFDLTVTAAPSGDGLSLAWNYRTDLFDRSSVLAMAGDFCELLRQIAAEPHRNISHFRLIDPLGGSVKVAEQCYVAPTVHKSELPLRQLTSSTELAD
jgi:acyl-CoA synthetase (AMP-forming)/AMP-acid ligase II